MRVKMIIAIVPTQKDDGIILTFPEEIKDMIDGVYCSDNIQKGTPTEIGLYICDVDLEEHESWGSYIDPPEHWEELNIIESNKIFDFPVLRP